MRHILFAMSFLVASQASAAPTIAKDLKTGIGLGGGNLISGFTGKQYLSDNLAVQAHLGLGGWGIGLGADVLWTQAKVWQSPGATIHWGYGAGAGFWQSNGGPWAAQFIDVSGILEAALRLKNYPIEFTADLRPSFAIGSGLGVHIGSGGAARWFF